MIVFRREAREPKSDQPPNPTITVLSTFLVALPLATQGQFVIQGLYLFAHEMTEVSYGFARELFTLDRGVSWSKLGVDADADAEGSSFDG